MDRSPLRIVDDSGLTDRSIAVWRLTRPLFGEFLEAACGDIESFRNTKYDIDLWTQRTGYSFTYGLVLRDDRRQELWLNGCTAGYRGKGPGGTEQVLAEEGYLATHIAFVEEYGTFHFVKDRSEPLLLSAERRPEPREAWGPAAAEDDRP